MRKLIMLGAAAAAGAFVAMAPAQAAPVSPFAFSPVEEMAPSVAQEAQYYYRRRYYRPCRVVYRRVWTYYGWRVVARRVCY